jgi:hypothetical protein
MDVFATYKPFRNKIAALSVEDALSVIWAHTQFLQIDDFNFPKEIEVPDRYLKLQVPQQWISEWQLELLAKEVVLNSGGAAKDNRTLRKWKTLSETINSLKKLEDDIYGAYGSSVNPLVELIRIAHRQFIWQGNSPNSASIIRYFKIFNRPAIDAICEQKIGLNVWEIFMCGAAAMGYFLDRPAIVVPFKSEMKALTVDKFEKFFAFASRPLAELRSQLKAEQQYNENFSYAYSSLRAWPLVRMTYQGSDALVCPQMTLLYWRFTGGLYYELITVPEFGNEFGDGFQEYVGAVIERACPDPMRRLGEADYAVGKAQKKTVDWIVAEDDAALFVECKARRLSWGAKVSLNDLAPLEADIDNMAAAVVQVYKTIADYRDGAYPHFRYDEKRKIFPTIVTLENWHMFGDIMLNKLAEAVASKLEAAGLAKDDVGAMPYSVLAIEELEVALQIARDHGIARFIEGKLNDPEMKTWGWHGYMTNQYPKAFPAKKLFEAEFDELFAKVYAAQTQ